MKVTAILALFGHSIGCGRGTFALGIIPHGVLAHVPEKWEPVSRQGHAPRHGANSLETVTQPATLAVTGPQSCAIARRCGLGSSDRPAPRAPAALCRCAAS